MALFFPPAQKLNKIPMQSLLESLFVSPRLDRYGAAVIQTIFKKVKQQLNRLPVTFLPVLFKSGNHLAQYRLQLLIDSPKTL